MFRAEKEKVDGNTLLSPLLFFGLISDIIHNHYVISIQFLMLDLLQKWEKQNNINVPHIFLIISNSKEQHLFS